MAITSSFTKHLIVNTGDLWSAANHNTYIKGNWDFMDEIPFIALYPHDGYTMITGTGATGPGVNGATAVGTKPSWSVVAFPDTAAEIGFEWSVLDAPDFGVSPYLETWGYMASANTGTKNIQWGARWRYIASGANFVSSGHAGVVATTWQVQNTAGVLMYDKQAMTGFAPGNNNHAIIRLIRDGLSGLDDAVGEFRYIGGRISYDYV